MKFRILILGMVGFRGLVFLGLGVFYGFVFFVFFCYSLGFFFGSNKMNVDSFSICFIFLEFFNLEWGKVI